MLPNRPHCSFLSSAACGCAWPAAAALLLPSAAAAPALLISSSSAPRIRVAPARCISVIAPRLATSSTPATAAQIHIVGQCCNKRHASSALASAASGVARKPCLSSTTLDAQLSHSVQSIRSSADRRAHSQPTCVSEQHGLKPLGQAIQHRRLRHLADKLVKCSEEAFMHLHADAGTSQLGCPNILRARRRQGRIGCSSSPTLHPFICPIALHYSIANASEACPHPHAIFRSHPAHQHCAHATLPQPVGQVWREAQGRSGVMRAARKMASSSTQERGHRSCGTAQVFMPPCVPCMQYVAASRLVICTQRVLHHSAPSSRLPGATCHPPVQPVCAMS